MTEQLQELEHGIAALGNGYDEELTAEQLEKINTLYQNTEASRTKVMEYFAEKRDPDLKQLDYSYLADHEACRRYLVTCSWDLPKAQKQLENTFKWRMQPNTLSRPMYDYGRGVSITQKSPYALSIRLVGWDKVGRPIMYSNYNQAYERFNPNHNAEHMAALFDAAQWVLEQRRKQDPEKYATAASRQWCAVIDFDGFGFYDQNPKSGILVAGLMQHFPEVVGGCMLINAPTLFKAAYKLISPFLDARVKSKVAFVDMNLQNSEKARSDFDDLYGSDIANWLVKEISNSLKHKQKIAATKSKEKRAYWLPEEEGFDGRGVQEYVESECYVDTPGDVHMARQKQQQQQDGEEKKEG